MGLGGTKLQRSRIVVAQLGVFCIYASAQDLCARFEQAHVTTHEQAEALRSGVRASDPGAPETRQLRHHRCTQGWRLGCPALGDADPRSWAAEPPVDPSSLGVRGLREARAQPAPLAWSRSVLQAAVAPLRMDSGLPDIAPRRSAVRSSVFV